MAEIHNIIWEYLFLTVDSFFLTVDLFFDRGQLFSDRACLFLDCGCLCFECTCVFSAGPGKEALGCPGQHSPERADLRNARIPSQEPSPE